MPEKASPVAVVVDAYSAGRHLPEAFSRVGARMVHVQGSATLLSSVPPPNLAPYLANVVHHGLDSTVRELSAFNPVCIVPGQETGVLLADRLSETLGLPGNGTALSPARRDKYLMIETLRAAGIHCARQWKAGSADELIAWAGKDGDHYPYVVKPLRSASSDAVFICRSAEEIRVSVAAILGAPDIFDQPNTEVLIQSFLEGPEFAVDTVSSSGRRYVCSVWVHEKSADGGRPTYNNNVLLAPEDEPVPELIAYVDTVLEALGIRFGAAHAELILTPDGPALVEIGARMNGSLNLGFQDLCLGENQAELQALSYVDPAEFARRHSGNSLYRKLREGICYNARTSQQGLVTGIDEETIEEIRSLPTVVDVLTKVAPGQRIRPTTDLLSSPLRVFLAGHEMASLLADHERILALKDRVFHVEPLTN